MTTTIRLPRMLTHAARTGLTHEVAGSTVREALDYLFTIEPGLRQHLVDETGSIRPHVSIFVDGSQASLKTEVDGSSSIRVLHAVSGGSGSAGHMQDSIDL